MIINRILGVLPAAILALLSIFAGCAHLQKDLVELKLDSCPQQTTEQLAAQAYSFSSASDDLILQCALGLLRSNSDPTLVRSSLGARVCMLLAERTNDQASREKLAAEGVRDAEAALKEGAEQDGKVHYYLAVNLGLAIREHITLAYKQIDRLEQELKKALELSPDEDSGGPARILGMLYLKAPAWPKGIGDSDKALEMLAEVVRKHPEHPLNHLFYAQALWEVEAEAGVDQARLQLAEGKKLLDTENWGKNREPWLKEFLELEKELNKSGR
jgi:hypothetical protein